MGGVFERDPEGIGVELDGWGCGDKSEGGE